MATHSSHYHITLDAILKYRFKYSWSLSNAIDLV